MKHYKYININKYREMKNQKQMKKRKGIEDMQAKLQGIINVLLKIVIKVMELKHRSLNILNLSMLAIMEVQSMRNLWKKLLRKEKNKIINDFMCNYFIFNFICEKQYK